MEEERLQPSVRKKDCMDGKDKLQEADNESIHMARILDLLPNEPQNEWANECRGYRMQTRHRDNRHYYGDWPFNPHEFAEWANPYLLAMYPDIKPLTGWRWKHWESTKYTTDLATKKAVRAVMKKYLHLIVSN